ncbi:DUF423 domain-containing protein [Legionella sainthelensi]|uniref:DUF423 domain-containing protein n=1 Tax=Legionella sainthelensi TaxID=28087 RepID=UPI000E208A19|nr:DUF423 domain-containing protein [Legionella sainthelensi]
MMHPTSESVMAKHFMVIGALSAMFATIFGAFAAHALKTEFSAYQMGIFQTGVFYQFIHSVALLCVGMILCQFNAQTIRVSGWLFFAGILLFSGSLYTLSLTKIKIIGMITPIGGACFIAAWLLLAVGIYKTN